jgi:hypothetical protein
MQKTIEGQECLENLSCPPKNPNLSNNFTIIIIIIIIIISSKIYPPQ